MLLMINEWLQFNPIVLYHRQTYRRRRVCQSVTFTLSRPNGRECETSRRPSRSSRRMIRTSSRPRTARMPKNGCNVYKLLWQGRRNLLDGKTEWSGTSTSRIGRIIGRRRRWAEPQGRECWVTEPKATRKPNYNTASITAVRCQTEW